MESPGLTARQLHVLNARRHRSGTNRRATGSRETRPKCVSSSPRSTIGPSSIKQRDRRPRSCNQYGLSTRRTCLAHARGPLVLSALRELLSDEIDHGRIGWAHLAALDRSTRNEVSRWLLPMTYLNPRLWQKETPYAVDFK